MSVRAGAHYRGQRSTLGAVLWSALPCFLGQHLPGPELANYARLADEETLVITCLPSTGSRVVHCSTQLLCVF